MSDPCAKALSVLYEASLNALTPQLKRDNLEAYDSLQRAILRARRELAQHDTTREKVT